MADVKTETPDVLGQLRAYYNPNGGNQKTREIMDAAIAEIERLRDVAYDAAGWIEDLGRADVALKVRASVNLSGGIDG